MSKGFQGPFELTKFPSGQSNPTYRIRAASGDYVMRRKPFGKLLPSAHAVDREYRLLVGAASARFPRAAAARPVRRSRGHRRDLLRDGAGAGARLTPNGALPGLRPADAPANVRAIDRHARRPARHRSRGGRARRFRQARQLFRAPGRALDAPVSRLPDRLSAGDGAADRVPAGDASRAVAHVDRPRRLSHRQCRVRRRRHADRGARLGAGDARRSGRRFLLSRDAVDDAGRRRLPGWPASILPRSASRRSTRSSRAIPSVPACPSATSSTGISPTICSASPASSRASRSACIDGTASHAQAAGNGRSACRCSPRRRGASR